MRGSDAPPLSEATNFNDSDAMMNIVILYGQIQEGAGQDEQDTLVQVEAVSAALSRMGFRATSLPFSLDVPKAVEMLQRIRPERVFNLVESVEGQGRLIHLAPAVLDSLRIPYTGAKTEGLFLTSNKLLAKKFLRSSGIPTPNWFSLRDLENGAPVEDGVYILKSVWEHASIGLDEGAVVRAADPSTLRRMLEQRKDRLGGEGFAEAYIEGREFNLSLLAGDNGPEVLPPAEIRFDTFPEEKLKIVDYRAKWDEESFEYHHTPRSFTFSVEDEPLLHRLGEIAEQCRRLFELRGYARVDFRVDRAGNPMVLEVNANPCLSPDAGFFAAAKQRGLSYEQVVGRILEDSGED